MSEPEPSRLHMSTSMGMGGTLPPLSLPPLSLPPMKTDHLGLSPIGMPYSAYSQSLHSPSLASPSNHMNSSMSLSHAPSSPMGYTNGSSRQSSIKRRINPNDRMMVPQFQHPFHPPDRSLESHLNEPPIKQLKSVPGSPNIHSGPSTPSSLQMRFSMDSPSSSMGHSPLSMSSQPSTSQIPNGNGYPINYPQNPNVSAIPPIHMPPSSQAPQMAMQHPMFSIPNNRPPDYREQTGPSANGLIIMSQPGPSFQRPRMPSADYPQNGASYPDRTQQSTTISPQAVSSIHNFPSQMSPQQQHYPYPRVEPSLQRSMSLPTTTDQQTVQKVDQETKPVIQSPKPVVPQPLEQPKVQAKPAKTETLGQFQHKIEQHQLKPEQVAPRIASVEKKPVFQPTPEDSPEMSVPASPTKTELPPPTTPVATSIVIPQPLPEPQVLVQKPPPTEPPKTLEQRLAQPSTAIQSNGAPRPPLMHPILGRPLKLEEIKILRQRQILHKRLMEHKLKQLKAAGQIPGTSATSPSTARTISGLPLALQLRLKQSPKHQAMLQHRITQLQNQRAAAAAAASAPGPSGLQKPPQLPVLVPTILRKKPEQPPLSQSQIKQLLSERLKSPPGPPPPQSSSLQQMLAARSLQAPRILHPGQLIPAQLHPSQANMPVRSVLQAHQQQLIAGAPPRPGLGPVIVNPHIGHQVIPGLMVHPPKRDQTVSIQMAKLIDERMPQPIVSNKEQYRFFKKKMRFLVYENECYQEELRMLERKLLKLSRDKHYLLDRLLAYEKLSDESQDDSDSSQKTIDERPKAKKRNRNKGKKDSGSATRSASGTPSPSPSPAPQTLLAQMLQPSTSGLGTGKLHPDVKMEPKSPIYPSERKYSFDDSMRLTMPSTSSDYVYPGPSSAPIVTNFNPFDGAFSQDQPELFSELRNDSNGHPESFSNDSAPSTSYSPPTSPRINGSLPASPSDPSTSHTKKLDSDDRPV